jgi:predicted ATP-dependent Lon-type protease
MASAKPQTERIMPLATVDATKPARLDAKILEHLSDRVILKPLTRWNEAYKEFPRYVMEYLCARFVDPTDPLPGQQKIDRISGRTLRRKWQERTHQEPHPGTRGIHFPGATFPVV